MWLDRGVDGFRIDVAHGLVKADGLPEWHHEQDLLDAGDDATGRAPMWDQDGVHEIYRGWRKIVDGYGDRMLVGEAWVATPRRLARYVRPDGLHQVFSFDLLTAPWRAPDIREAIRSSIAANAEVGAPTAWVLSNHDVVRHPTRLTLPPGRHNPEGIASTDPQPDEDLGLRRGRAASAVMLALPGSAYLYQGEELGLPEHTTLPDEVRQDPVWFRKGGTVAGRDGCRVPIPWEADAPAFGFSPSGRTWLRQPRSFARYAVDRQRGVPGSTLELYRALLDLRRRLRLGAGELTWDAGFGDDVVAFRIRTPAASVIVVANLGTTPLRLPADGQLLVSTDDLNAGQVPTDVTVWLRTA